MRDLKIDQYPDACVVSLPDTSQRALLLSIQECLNAGIPAFEVMQRIQDIERDPDTAQAWGFAMEDLARGNTNFCEVLSKTGLFSKEIQAILMITGDFFIAMPAISDYLKSRKDRN